MKEFYIQFMAGVSAETAARLFDLLDVVIAGKYDRLRLMLSTPGGSVSAGLSVYNFLRGAPFETVTYNFGSADSIGAIVYCAGRQRICVPHARFLLHGIRWTTDAAVSLSEKELEEALKSIRVDQENINRVLAEATGRPFDQVS